MVVVEFEGRTTQHRPLMGLMLIQTPLTARLIVLDPSLEDPD